jgi:uncharacterized protein YgiB involved in biofilm formation
MIAAGDPGEGRMEKRRGERRRRSAAITLVLAGSLTGCGDPEAQRDVYTNLESCRKDWGDPKDCTRADDGRYSSSYFFGPRYFGSSYPSGRPRSSPNAVDATRAGRGGVTHMASGARASSPSSGSSVSRSGFGSSSRSMSSGS